MPANSRRDLIQGLKG